MNVDHGEAVEAAAQHRFLDTLLHRRDKRARQRPTHNRIGELKAGSTKQGRNTQVRYRVLAVAAGLFLHFARSFGGTRDGFAIGHAHLSRVYVCPELAGEPFDGNRYVHLAKATQDRLTRFGNMVKSQGRILGQQLVQRRAKLVIVGLGARRDRHTKLRHEAIVDRHRHRQTFRRQCVAGTRVGKLRHTADIARRKLRHRRLLLAAQREQRA